MKALSIKQPWAHAIINLGKDIENRDWFTNFTGTIAVHASKKIEKDEINAFMVCCGDLISNTEYGILVDAFYNKTLVGGAILGTVEIVDCVKKSDSPWFFGDYGFVLKNPKPLVKPIPINGALGFWNVPAEIKAEIEKQLLVTV